MNNSSINIGAAGGTTISINGQNVTVNGASAAALKTYRIDEKKAAQFMNINSIRVDSPVANVRIKNYSAPNLICHLHGEANLERPIKLEISVRNHELFVLAKYNGTSVIRQLDLEIFCPDRLLDSIFINTTSGCVDLVKRVNQISVNTASGNVFINSITNSINVNTMSGIININADSTNMINMNCSSMSGNIDVSTRNVGAIRLNAKTNSGMVRNLHRPSGVKEANMNISSMSGSITIR